MSSEWERTPSFTSSRIGGAGMSALALIVCAGLGARGDGQSDRAESTLTCERLRAAGLEPRRSATTLTKVPAGAEVVVSTAIGAEQPRAA